MGVDHTTHEFPASEWDAKKVHYTKAHQLLGPKNIKICRVYIGLFLEDSIGPWFGFDTKAGIYEAIGTGDEKITFTSLKDVGLAIASLVALPLEDIPEQVRIAGDSLSIKQIAKTMTTAGAGPIAITSVPLEGYRQRVVDAQKGTETFLRFLMGEGRIDHSTDGMGNLNELVNPEEKTWKWKTMVDLAEETRGKPWGDSEWPPPTN